MNAVAQQLAAVLGVLFLVAGVFIVVSERVSGRPAGKLWTSYWLQFVIVGALLVPAFFGGYWWIGLVTAMVVVTTRELFGVLRVKGFPAWGWLVLAVPGLCLAFSAVLGLQPGGFGWVAYLYAIVELNDAVALMVGKFFGKRLIWPRLSPSKTVAGSVAGFLAAVGAAFAFWFLVPSLNWQSVLAIGLGLGVMGQAADLAASAVKRWAGVKDYSNAVPTHGGVLDVYDSFILTSPLVFALSQWLR